MKGLSGQNPEDASLLKFQVHVSWAQITATSCPPLRLTTQNPSSKDTENDPWQHADSAQTPMPLPSSKRAARGEVEPWTWAAERKECLSTLCRTPLGTPALTPQISGKMSEVLAGTGQTRVHTELQQPAAPAQKGVSSTGLQGPRWSGPSASERYWGPGDKWRAVLSPSRQMPAAGEGEVVYRESSGVFRRVHVKGKDGFFSEPSVTWKFSISGPTSSAGLWRLTLKRFTECPSARFSQIYLFQENWKHSGQMKSPLSICTTKESKHLQQKLGLYLKGDPTKGSGQRFPTLKTPATSERVWTGWYSFPGTSNITFIPPIVSFGQKSMKTGEQRTPTLHASTTAMNNLAKIVTMNFFWTLEFN